MNANDQFLPLFKSQKRPKLAKKRISLRRYSNFFFLSHPKQVGLQRMEALGPRNSASFVVNSCYLGHTHSNRMHPSFPAAANMHARVFLTAI